MNVSLKQLEAAVGELILPKWRGLLRWARSQRFIPGPGIRWRETPNGIVVWAVRGRGFRTPFRVALAGSAFRVGTGTLDGEVPWIGAVRLDGEREDGTRGEAPPLPFGPVIPDRESWVCVRRGKDGRGEIVHRTELGPDVQPLAWVQWEARRPTKVWQIVRHHLGSAPGPAGRIWYWGV